MGKKSLRRNGIALIAKTNQTNKQNTVFGYNLKSDRMISVPFQGKTFNNTTIQVYAPIANAKEAEVDQFYEDREHLKKMFYSSLGIGMQK
jgi:exonuclease III